MDRIERETVSSAITVKTDTGSKVLPGDKRGLPYEVWAIILSYLPVEDLCRSAIVCKTWNEIIQSLDHTRWKDLYLHSTEWRHPYWPLNLHSDPRSWRLAYKEQYLASTFWTRIDRGRHSVTCMSVFKRNKLRKTITVGIGKDFESLKGALSVANDYDRILVYPGIYDEQFEMASKIPFELIGIGELGSVILVVCIEQTAITGRINNLVFRAPWFTNFILKVRSGYLQVDNCIMEDGMVYVQNPGTVVMSYCTFRHATVILQHVNASIIQNCEFSQTDSAAITVEGYPKEDKNWTFQGLNSKVMELCTLQKKAVKNGELTIPKSAFSLSTATTSNQKSGVKSHYERQLSADTEFVQRKMSHDFDLQSHDPDLHMSHDHGMHMLHDRNVPTLAAFGADPLDSSYKHTRRRKSTTESNFSRENSRNDGSSSEGEDGIVQTSAYKTSHKGTTHLGKTKRPPNTMATGHWMTEEHSKTTSEIRHDNEKIKRIENFVDDCAKYSIAGNSREPTDDEIDDLDLCLPMSRSSKPTEGHGSHTRSRSHEGQLASHNNTSLPALDLSTFKPNKHFFDNLESDTESETNNKNQNNGIDNKGGSSIPALDLHSLASPSSKDLHGNGVAENGAEGQGQDLRVQDESDGSSTAGSAVSLHTASSNDVSLEGEEEAGDYNSDGRSTTSSSSSESLPVSDGDSDFSSSEESVIMLTYPERHQPRSLSAQKECNDVASINSQNQSEHIDIIQDNDMRKILNDVRGCCIHKCRITQSKGAVMVSLQSHAIIMECEMSSVGYGIRCIQNSRTVVLKNEIHHCRTSGVYMRLAATGLITGNDIHSNCEAGIDIRKNADPIVQCNRIHHGKRSGVVVLGSGRGQIRHNDIYQNKEAGVYILFRGNPIVCNNQVYSGKAAGIAINEGGRGYITGNVITGNQWGGVDIRHGGDPIIHHNTVCNGISDGIVIGEGGRGSIQTNIITGNAGCGVWMMAAQQPLIHGNQIHSNRDSGISLVNRMDSSHSNEVMAAESKDTPSQNSVDFLGLTKEDTSVTTQRNITMATIEYNKVYNNEGKGIAVQFGEAVMVDSNYVNENKGDGIYVNQPEPVTLTNNHVTFNCGSGVNISGQGSASIHGNGIYDNKAHGIWCQGHVDITDNDILGNTGSAVAVNHSSNVKVSRNRVHAGTGYLISITDTQSAELEDNIFYATGDTTIDADLTSKFTQSNNQILPPPATNTDVRKEQVDMFSTGSTRWLLANPAPRPHITTPPPVNHIPSQHVTAASRVTIPAQISDEGSKFCVIL